MGGRGGGRPVRRVLREARHPGGLRGVATASGQRLPVKTAVWLLSDVAALLNLEWCRSLKMMIF